MISRRSRLQVKPNIGPLATKREEIKHVSKPENKGAPVCEENIHVVIDVPIPVAEPSENREMPKGVDTMASPPRADPSPIPTVFVAPAPPSPVKSPPHIPHFTHDLKTTLVPRQRLSSTSSELSTASKRERKKWSGTEELDPKTMRMVDLISWNPCTQAKWDRSRIDSAETQSEIQRETAPAAPQLKLDASGKLVVDETSLVLDERATQSVWDVVDECEDGRVQSRQCRQLSSTAFRKKVIYRGSIWNEKETDLFYEVLRHTGPDFTLMHHFFPRRTRMELKRKYNREERVNWARINDTLSRPAMLDDSLTDRTNAMLEAIDEEEREKREEKEGRKKRRAEAIEERRENDASTSKKTKKKTSDEGEEGVWLMEEEWNEGTADLEAEAATLIIEMEELTRRREEKASRLLAMKAAAKELIKQKTATTQDTTTQTKKAKETKEVQKPTRISKKAKEVLDAAMAMAKKKEAERRQKKMEAEEADTESKKAPPKPSVDLSGYPEEEEAGPTPSSS